MNETQFTNRLIKENSPYLLQHAHNPVDWFAWGDEAFEKAQAEDKPILVSIGYSACHWCHVMEHESFENEATASMMNENFVCIKVDLEERPDVDQIYMTFVQMTIGSGGYPLNVFLTPDRKPFFGGTYFPPISRFNMPSFERILTSIAEAYRERKEEVLTSANEILSEIKKIRSIENTGEILTLDLCGESFASFAKYFDSVNGGFGSAPKFPPPMSLEFLLRYFYRTKDKSALEMVEKTCRKMANGGIYDHLGGGFHRYTVDAIWLVPHFEKMLYDNAQLARIYLHLFQITKDKFYRNVAVETLEYVKREMLDARGGFYTAQDADSEGSEGKFFVWTPVEIVEILGESDGRIFNYYFDVTERGNFEVENILNVKFPPETVAAHLQISEDELKNTLKRGREKLFTERELRIKPFRDEKVLTAWNGLMLATFAEASQILENVDYLEIARRNADFILENLQKDNHLLRTYINGEAKLNAYLEDYANFADGLIELFQASGEAKYLQEAKRLADLMIAEFWDSENGGFFFTGTNHEKLLIRAKDFHDNAVPSGNSAATDVLLKLSKLCGEEKYESFAAATLQIVAAQIRQYPQAFGRALSALEFHLNPTKEIVILGEKGNDFEREIWSNYLPDKVLISANVDVSEKSELIPLLENKEKIGELATVYICENFACLKPVATVEELRAILLAG